MDEKKKGSIGFVPMPHTKDKARHPFNPIKLKCGNPDCETPGEHAIPLEEIPPELREVLPQISAHLNTLADRLTELKKNDPQAIELIQPMAKAGFTGDHPLVEAIGMSPVAVLKKETAPYDQNAVQFVRYPLCGQNGGQPAIMQPPTPTENFKLECAEHFKKLPPLVQFTVLERLIARGFTPEDFGLQSTAPVA